MIAPFTQLQTPQVLQALTAHNPVSAVLLTLSLAIFFVMLGVAITTSRVTQQALSTAKTSKQDPVVLFPTNPTDVVKEALRG